MRKVIAIFLIFLLCISIGGCIRPMSRGERLTKELGSEHEIADQMMEDIVVALDTGNADALKNLFSETALGEATDIDQQISALLNFYQGKMKNFDGFLSSSNSYGVKREQELTGYYTLTTDEEIYRVCYIYKVIDKEEPDNEGLSKLEIVKQSLYDNEDFHWQFYTSEPGAYMQE